MTKFKIYNTDISALTSQEKTALLLRFLHLNIVKPQDMLAAFNDYHSNNHVHSLQELMENAITNGISIQDLFQSCISFCSWSGTRQGDEYWRTISIKWRVFLLYLISNTNSKSISSMIIDLFDYCGMNSLHDILNIEHIRKCVYMILDRWGNTYTQNNLGLSFSCTERITRIQNTVERAKKYAV